MDSLAGRGRSRPYVGQSTSVAVSLERCLMPKIDDASSESKRHKSDAKCYPYPAMSSSLGRRFPSCLAPPELRLSPA